MTKIVQTSAMRARSQIAECSLSYDKDSANERNESTLTNCRVQPILCKDKKKIDCSIDW